MITLSLDTWVGIGSLITVLAVLSTQLRSTRAELKADIQRLDNRMTDLGAELKADLQRVESGLKSEIERVDDRVYALAAGLKPDIERAGEQRRGA